MSRFWKLLIGFSALVALLVGLALIINRHNAGPKPATGKTGFQVLSNEFANVGTIPARYTCAANNLSPPLTFKNAPAKAQSLVIIMHDLDAPGGDFTHWLVWNIPPSTKAFNEDAVVAGAVQGTTDFGSKGYGGPCPNSGTHRYTIDVYALDTKLNLSPDARRPDVEAAIKNHQLAHAQLIGIVTAPQQANSK